MFSTFFYTLKAKGLDVSLTEWIALHDALNKNLCNSSLTGFYYMARAILVKSETDFDKFDLAFEECFKGVKSDNLNITDRMLEWLDKSEMTELLHEEERYWLNQTEDMHVDKDDVETKFKERLKDQDSEHNGGNYWICTMGKTQFGNMGGNIGGIRVGGSTGYQSAFAVVGARKYKDFRNDKMLDNRQLYNHGRSNDGDVDIAESDDI